MDELPVKPIAIVKVRWKTLKLDILLIIIAIAFPILSFGIDLRNNRSDWFFRSGAVTTMIGILLAYRSLRKHYQKFSTDMARKEALASSIPQLKVDGWTLVLSIIGTLIWSYGDKFFGIFLK
jgi:hypothetical protein